MTRIVTLALILSTFTSCNRDVNTQNDNKVLFFTITTEDSQTYSTDSVKIQLVKKHDTKDTLLTHSTFVLNGKTHLIRLFTNYSHAPIDGGYLSFELDSLGIIYSKSMTWNSYSRLNCTNDSINNIIVVALENIILNDKFHSIDLNRLNKKPVAFTPEP